MGKSSSESRTESLRLGESTRSRLFTNSALAPIDQDPRDSRPPLSEKGYGEYNPDNVFLATHGLSIPASTHTFTA